MKKVSLFFLISLFMFRISCAQEFRVVYAYPKDDHARSIVQTPDSGYVVAGATTSFGDGSTNGFLLQLDKFGQGRWIKILGGSSIDWADCVQLTSDSGFVVAGYSNASGSYDGWLVKTDSLGDTLWTKTFGSIDWDFLHHVEQTADGGYIAAGSTFNSTFGNEDAWLVKTDANGNEAWNKSWGGTENDEARCVRVCTNNDFIVIGSTQSFGAGKKDAYLFRTNANGDTLWTKTFGDALDDEGRYVEQTFDGGFILAVSYTRSDSIKIFRLIKTDGSGNVQWSHDYFGSTSDAEPYEVHQLADGSFACFGYDKSSGGGGKDFMLLKTDPAGGFIRGTTYGNLKADVGFSFKPTYGNNFVLCGETESFGALPVNIMVISTDSIGLSTNPLWYSVDELPGGSVKSSSLSIFPNPAKREFTIHNSQFTIKSIEIFSVLGEKVYSNEKENCALCIVNCELPSGIYFVRAKSGNDFLSAKLIIAR